MEGLYKYITEYKSQELWVIHHLSEHYYSGTQVAIVGAYDSENKAIKAAKDYIQYNTEVFTMLTEDDVKYIRDSNISNYKLTKHGENRYSIEFMTPLRDQPITLEELQYFLDATEDYIEISKVNLNEPFTS